jgi:hypothetical protein
MAVALWARAALRLPVVAFAWYYLSHGVAMEGRSTRFPDGTSDLWLLYSALEGDGLLWQTLPVRFAWSGAMTAWVVGYPALTVLYATLGLLVLRGTRGANRAATMLMWLGLGAYGLGLVLVGFFATHGGLPSGANAGVYPYFGQHLVEAYWWLLLPSAVALLAVTVASLVLGRSASTRRRVTRAPQGPESAGPRPSIIGKTG